MVRIPVHKALVLCARCACFAQAAVQIDMAAPGTPFNPGVRGVAVPAINITRGEFTVGIPQTLQLSDRSSIRGVAGGIEAEMFNWKTRNNDARPTTLEYLRWARDHHAELVVTVNMRGLVGPDPA